MRLNAAQEVTRPCGTRRTEVGNFPGARNCRETKGSSTFPSWIGTSYIQANTLIRFQDIPESILLIWVVILEMLMYNFISDEKEKSFLENQEKQLC